MSSAEEEKPCCSSSSSTTIDYDAALDFFSEHFDPFKALNTKDLVLPSEKFTVYDNIHKYRHATLTLGSPQKKPEKASPKKPGEPVTSVRKFLPSQMPVPSTIKRVTKNMFNQMPKFKGPLCMLSECVENNEKIMVVTRHSHGIRGHCEANIVVFDKHWNLALKNCHEEWERKNRMKVLAEALNGERRDADGDQQVAAAKPTPTPRTTTTAGKKPVDAEVVTEKKRTTVYKRDVKQMVLRGEQIAYIVLHPERIERIVAAPN